MGSGPCCAWPCRLIQQRWRVLLPWRKQLLAQRRRLAAAQPWLARIHRLVALTQYERAMPWLDKLTSKAEQHLPMDDMELLLKVGVLLWCRSQVCKKPHSFRGCEARRGKMCAKRQLS